MVLTVQPGIVEMRLDTPMQTSLFGSAPLACRPISSRFEALDPRSSVLFQPGWVEGSDEAFTRLSEELPWLAMERPMYDKVVAVPRLICTVEPLDFAADHPLTVITSALESTFGRSFSSVGANLYRHGGDSVAWHRDRIRPRNRPGFVALVSLGSPRTLGMRRVVEDARNTTKTPQTTGATRYRWRLGHGDLLVMNGACQQDWEHCVPKEAGVGARISLAFRSQEAVEGPRLGHAGVPPLLASHNLR